MRLTGAPGLGAKRFGQHRRRHVIDRGRHIRISSGRGNPSPAIYGCPSRQAKNILVSLPSLSAVANLFGFTADFPGPYSSAKPFTSLLSKARDFLRGPISFTGVNARKENLITALSAPWHSSGYALSSPVGRPTSLTMNPSMSTPSQKGLHPLHRLDGPPQTLEGPLEKLYESFD